MHGRKRSEYKALQRDAAVVEKLAAKAVAWHQLQTELLQRRRSYCKDITQTLSLIEKAVTVNPDPLWLWKYRRELLLLSLQQQQDGSNSAAPSLSLHCLDTEARVTATALSSGNPKAYGAWHHRKWCLQQQQQQQENNSSLLLLLQSELELTAQLLQRDERNFHCWSYRRFVVSYLLDYCGATTTTNGQWKIDDSVVMGAQIITIPSDDHNKLSPPSPSPNRTPDTVQQQQQRAVLQTEWDFTETKIRDNFSNFSAFHYRSKLLPLMLVQGSDNDNNTIIQNELALVEAAIFTEPDDQTAWWYQRFLLDSYFVTDSSSETTTTTATALLQQHIEQLRELQDETNRQSKWVLTGLLQCLQVFAADSITITTDERRELLEQLIRIDPDRQGRYRYELRKLC